jgi:secreted PhoX family phosphatase
MGLYGPAATLTRLKTSDDSTGPLGRGTLNNCAAAVMPWGRALIAEENFDTYFTDAIDRIANESIARSVASTRQVGTGEDPRVVRCATWTVRR